MRKFYTAALLSMAVLAAPPAYADADDTYVTGNLYFNNDGFAGYGVRVGINDFEAHASKLKNLKYAIGAGLVVADSEGKGEAGNDKVGASATLGIAVVGVGDGDRIRPFVDLRSELDLDGDAIAQVGFISYGLGITIAPTDNFVYVGLGVQSLVDNLPTQPAASRTFNPAGDPAPTGDTGGEDPGTGGEDPGTGGEDPGTGGEPNTNPSGKTVQGCTRASDTGRPHVLEHNPHCG